MKKVFFLALFVFILSTGSMLIYLQSQKQGVEHLPLAQMNIGGDFTLSSDQTLVSLSDFQGKVVLIFFGYTSCPDICPGTLSVLASALNQLPAAEMNKVQVLFISVDPERDDAQTLNAFTQYFHPNILGLRGEKTVIDQVIKQYSGAYQILEDNSEANYLVDHTSAIYVVNPAGNVVELLPGNVTKMKIVETIHRLL